MQSETQYGLFPGGVNADSFTSLYIMHTAFMWLQQRVHHKKGIKICCILSVSTTAIRGDMAKAEEVHSVSQTPATIHNRRLYHSKVRQLRNASQHTAYPLHGIKASLYPTDVFAISYARSYNCHAKPCHSVPLMRLKYGKRCKRGIRLPRTLELPS